MKTIGVFLKESRRGQKLTLSDLEQKSKIKHEFLVAIEAEQWNALPEYPVVLGFVKSIAGFLQIDELKAAALLRRDYPPKKILGFAPKPDLPREFRWSPRLTFLAGILFVVVFVVSYLAVQYSQFVAPPVLQISQPVQDQTVIQNPLLVKGTTDADASVKINNQPVLVAQNGEFEAEIDISPSTRQILVEAVSRSGKRASVERSIKVELEKTKK